MSSFELGFNIILTLSEEFSVATQSATSAAESPARSPEVLLISVMTAVM